MPAPHNAFKAALAQGRRQMGCWLSMASPYLAEISGSAGYDWVLVDAEHAPNDLDSIVRHLQVLRGADSHVIVRPPIGETWMIKQILDAGAQTLLIPMVESPAQAEELVRATRYPPEGVRGVGALGARASQFGALSDYLGTAANEICLLAQIENRAGIAALDAILAVQGVDGVFIGPSDLSADLGYLGQASHPEVKRATLDVIARAVAAGKAAGILTLDATFQRECLEAGATFVATEVDIALFARTIRAAGAAAQSLAAETPRP